MVSLSEEVITSRCAILSNTLPPTAGNKTFDEWWNRSHGKLPWLFPYIPSFSIIFPAKQSGIVMGHTHSGADPIKNETYAQLQFWGMW